MRIMTLSGRTAKEILRDPTNLGFGIGFPVILILMMTAIQRNIPVSIFEINMLAPGMTVFGLSFITLFSAMLISKDRESALLQRLYTTPLTAVDFIAGYMLPLIPMALVQCFVCYLVAAPLGLKLSAETFTALLYEIPIAVFFIALGLLCGSVLGVKQVGGLCGALLTNVCALLSGIWFDLDLIGGAFENIAYMLPFVHAVEIEKAAINGTTGDMGTHLIWISVYAVVTLVLAVALFLRQMKRQ